MNKEKFGKIKKASKEVEIESFENQFISYVEYIIKKGISNYPCLTNKELKTSEAERIANLITLNVIDKKFWNLFLNLSSNYYKNKSAYIYIAKAIAFRTFPDIYGRLPIPIFLSKINGYRLCLLSLDSPSDAMEYFAQDNRVEVRCFVARNIKTPHNVLIQLSEDKDISVLQSLAENPKIPLEALKRLKNLEIKKNKTFTYDNEEKILNYLINEQIDIEKLDEHSIFTFLPQNYSLISLKSNDIEYCRDALKSIKNTILNKDICTNSLKAEKRKREVNNPVNSLWDLANHKNHVVRMCAAQHIGASQEILKHLSKDKDINVRRSVAKNPKTDHAILADLAKSRNHQILYDIANNINTPKTVLEFLSNHKNPDIRFSVAKNINTPPSILEVLFNGKKNIELAIAINSSIPENLAINLYNSARIEAVILSFNKMNILYNLAKNPNTPHYILDALLSESQDYKIRHNIAQNPKAPSRILIAFTQDQSLYEYDKIMLKIAENPATPVSLLEELINLEQFRYAIAKNTAAPAGILEILAKDSKIEILTAIAKNPQCPNNIFQRLAKDNNGEIRYAAFQNPSINNEIKRILENDSYVIFRGLFDSIKSATDYCELINNLKIPNELLRHLLKDKRHSVHYDVAQKIDISMSLLESLILDEDIHSLATLAERNDIPDSLLEYLGKSKYPYVLLSIAERPEISYHFQEYLAREKDESIRNALAQNPSVSSFILEYLSKDKSPAVRSMVANNPKTTIRNLKILSRDQNELVKKNAIKTLCSNISYDNSYEILKDIFDVLTNDLNLFSKQAIIALSYNKKTPAYVLSCLLKSKDINYEVLAILIANPNTPSESIKDKEIDLISAYGGSKKNPSNISDIFSLLNDNIPYSILSKYIYNGNWIVRYAVASNKNTPLDILIKLENDNHYLVKNKAIERVLEHK